MGYRKEDKQFLMLVAKRYGYLPENEQALFDFTSRQLGQAKHMLLGGDIVGCSVLLSEAIFTACAYDSSTQALDRFAEATGVKTIINLMCLPEPKRFRYIARNYGAELFRSAGYDEAMRSLRRQFTDIYSVHHAATGLASHAIAESLSVLQDKSEGARELYVSLQQDLVGEFTAMGKNVSDYDMELSVEVAKNFSSALGEGIFDGAYLCGSLSGAVFISLNLGIVGVDDVFEFYDYAAEACLRHNTDNEIPVLYSLQFSFEEDGTVDTTAKRIV